MSSYVGGKVSLEANCRRGSEYGHGGKRGKRLEVYSKSILVLLGVVVKHVRDDCEGGKRVTSRRGCSS